MSKKIKLYDATKCTGCRGCQLACKQWNDLPAEQTENRGSYQNPQSLNPNTWLLMHFDEVDAGADGVKWIFRNESCMHCTDAACVKVCPSGALTHTKYGTVVLDQKKCIGCRECVTACPFDIPQYDAKTEKTVKCDMCFSRLENNLEPACVKACPTGALQFGDEDEMQAIIKDRLAALKGKGHLYGDKFVGGTHMLYILPEQPVHYAGLPQNPMVPASLVAWKDWLKPLSLLAPGAVLAGSFLHYLTRGPKDVCKEASGECNYEPSPEQKGDA